MAGLTTLLESREPSAIVVLHCLRYGDGKGTRWAEIQRELITRYANEMTEATERSQWAAVFYRNDFEALAKIVGPWSCTSSSNQALVCARSTHG